MAAQKNNSHYEVLKDKFIHRHRKLQEKVWSKHAEALDWLSTYSKEMGIASMSGLMLLSSPISGFLPTPSLQLPANHDQYMDIDPTISFRADLGSALPHDIESLTQDQEQKIAEILSRETGYTVTAELNGIRLERNYGYIGQEQHLARYPGDTMETHFESNKEAALYGDKGMAPGLGAWGYFAPSREQMAVKDALREKWYIAVQTFRAPGFADHTGEYISFFKFRKMIVVNTENGRAVVADIGDAGPGESTGKQLGGSPEVMQYLQRVDGSQKGPVLFFFIDDPEDKVPLGPVTIKSND